MVKSKTIFELSRMLSLSLSLLKLKRLLILLENQFSSSLDPQLCRKRLFAFLLDLLPFVSVMLFCLICCFHIYELGEICF